MWRCSLQSERLLATPPMASRKKTPVPAAKAAKRLARVEVTIDGTVVDVRDVSLGYNYEKKGLLIDFVIPLAASKIGGDNTKIEWRDGDVVLVVDTVRASAAAAAAAAVDAVEALRHTVTDAFDLQLAKRAPKFSLEDAPPRLCAAVALNRAQLSELRGSLAGDAVPVGERLNTDRFFKKHADVAVRGVSFYVDDDTFPRAIADRLETAIGNHDNDEALLASAIRAYLDCCGGVVEVADDDTLLLRPGRMASAGESKRVRAAFAKLNYEEDARDVADRVVDDMAALKPSFFWWD